MRDGTLRVHAVTDDPKSYRSPLSTRYASEAMRANFSDHKRFTTWRRLWIALAEGQRELGLQITVEQVAELRAHAEDGLRPVTQWRQGEAIDRVEPVSSTLYPTLEPAYAES